MTRSRRRTETALDDALERWRRQVCALWERGGSAVGAVVRARAADEAVEIVLDHDLDISHLTDLAEALERALEASPGGVTLDLDGCQHLDAQVAGYLLAAQGRFRARGVPLRMRLRSTRARQVLALVAEATRSRPAPATSPD